MYDSCVMAGIVLNREIEILLYELDCSSHDDKLRELACPQ